MDFIDPHIHIAARTTDDLHRMAVAGCVAVAEPAFWMGYDRTSVNGFYDYFRQLTEWEPSRATKYGIRHYAWMGLNAKEADDVGFAREVISILPEFLDRPTVLGIGEIGLNKNTKGEVESLLMLIDLGLERGELMLFHTPHLADKYAGTRMILDILRADRRVDPTKVCIDHCEEHTIRMALEEGYWAGMTLYPTTKATPDRAADMIELYGPDRILVNSSADWGPSDPMAVPEFMAAMRRRGHDPATIQQIVYHNPLAFWKLGDGSWKLGDGS
ncbi:MAG: TatD family hydrolase [Patescibacteria group bacterium]|nr:TatD family hydrolase [Patescibacteria group bacterium]